MTLNPDPAKIIPEWNDQLRHVVRLRTEEEVLLWGWHKIVLRKVRLVFSSCHHNIIGILYNATIQAFIPYSSDSPPIFNTFSPMVCHSCKSSLNRVDLFSPTISPKRDRQRIINSVQSNSLMNSKPKFNIMQLYYTIKKITASHLVMTINYLGIDSILHIVTFLNLHRAQQWSYIGTQVH